MLTSFLGACCSWSDAYLLPRSVLQLERCLLPRSVLRVERCLRAAAGAMLTSFLGACCGWSNAYLLPRSVLRLAWSDAYLLPRSVLQLKRCWTALTSSLGAWEELSSIVPAAARSQGGGKSCPALFQPQHAPREEVRAVQHCSSRSMLSGRR